MTPLKQAIAKCNELCGDDNWQAGAMCIGLLAGYDRRWGPEQKDIELLEVEKVYTSKLPNVNTGRTSRTYTLAGKLDKLVQGGTGVVLYDHKTTSHDISDPTSTYWRQLAIDSQASHYELLLLANGINLSDIVWDVVKKPGIRPKQIAAKDLKETQETGIYHGYGMSEETLAHLADSPRENGQCYAARLARETIDNPEKYFARRSIPRTRQEIEDYTVELWQVSKQISHARKTDQHYRNSGACFSYNTPCQFLGLCSSTDMPDSENWQKRSQVHAELTEDIGKDALTNSRLQTFATCRRKHYYRFELGIERVNAVESEALSFGNLWHDCLDSLWTAYAKEKENGDTNSVS